MHSAAYHHYQLVPSFSNYTPRAFEVQAVRRTRGLPTMSIMATRPVVPVTLPSVTEDAAMSYQESVTADYLEFDCKDAHFDSTDEDNHKDHVQPLTLRLSPILSDDKRHNEKLMTRTTLLALPPNNPSYEMAKFLRSTGPFDDEIQKPVRVSTAPRNALRFFKSKDKHSTESLTTSHQRLNHAIKSENQLASVQNRDKKHLPEAVQQRVSSAGKKYLEIAAITRQYDDSAPTLPAPDHPPRLSSVIFDSTVSISFDEDQEPSQTSALRKSDSRGRRITRDGSGLSVRILTDTDRSPVRPSASEPSTPPHDSGIEPADGPHFHPVDRFSKVDAKTPLSSNPRSPALRSKEPYTALPAITKRNSTSNTIAQPSPKRVNSHPVLLARNSSDVTALCLSRNKAMEQDSSVPGDPGPPPPPRSPLRPQQSPISIETALEQTVGNTESKTTAEETATHEPPSTVQAIGYHQLVGKSTSGCINSSSASTTSSDIAPRPLNRRLGANGKTKSQSLPIIRASVPGTSPKARRRLRRTRPQEAKSIDAGKISRRVSFLQEVWGRSEDPSTEFNHKPVVSLMGPGVALPIERVPVPKPVTTRKPATPPVLARRSLGQRPRSARIPPRDVHGLQTPPLSRSPSGSVAVGADEIMLPSPPPDRQLPPTPPRKPSHGLSESAVSNMAAPRDPIQSPSGRAPPPPALTALNTTFPAPPSSAKSASSNPSSATFGPASPPRTASLRPSYLDNNHSRHSSLNDRDRRRSFGVLEARLEALERHNRLLEAALIATLKTNGALNGCPYHSSAGPGNSHSHSRQGSAQHSHPQSDGRSNGHDNSVEKSKSQRLSRTLSNASASAGMSDADRFASVGHPAFNSDREDGEGRRIGSSGSDRSAKSALDVYLSTRGH